MDPVRQVDWLASREHFDRVVEALLQRMWSSFEEGLVGEAFGVVV